MKLVRRNDSLFPTFWTDLFDNNWYNVPSPSQAGVSIPAVNIQDTANGFVIELAAPGVQKEDFSINFEKGLLTVSTEKKSESSETDKEGNYSRREFNYETFRRSFTIPNTANTERIEAKYENGILNISIPKKEEAKPKPAKLIEVK